MDKFKPEKRRYLDRESGGHIECKQCRPWR